MSKPTPGPWKATHDSHGRFQLIGPDGTPLDPDRDNATPGEAEANAALIAAAPDLLAALKSMVNYYAPKHSEWWHGPHQVSITKAAKAAINKAGGAK